MSEEEYITHTSCAKTRVRAGREHELVYNRKEGMRIVKDC